MSNTEIATASNKKSNRKNAYMDMSMQQEFADVLMRHKNEITSLSAGAQPVEAEKSADDSDVATNQEAMTLELRRRERDAMMVRKISVSLKAIADGDYGFCADCGGEIGYERLHARPTAGRCVPCKEISEKGEFQFAKRRLS